MKEITAILINYSDQSSLYKALNSLNIISSKLHTIIVLLERDTSLHTMIDQKLFANIEYHTFKANQAGKALNDTISKIKSEYVLFLQETDYLAPQASSDSFAMNSSQAVLGHIYRYKNISLHLPLLVRTSLLQRNPFLLDHQLPFKEARFAIWLSNINDSLKFFKDGLVKQSKQHTTPDLTEKLKFAKKYQLEKIDTQHPTLSIVIANYNMEKYVETTIASCLFQNEQAEQVCIIDDGSTDNSYKQIKSWKNESKVQVFHKLNEGKARALNDLLAHVTSDFILELDADDWLDPDAVSEIKKNLANSPEDVAVLYGNLRKWKQQTNDVLFKSLAMGRMVNGRKDLLSYRFPLGPRIYRTSSLKAIGGFPIVAYNNGRLYEDVSVLNRLIKIYRFQYVNFTVYNVREHKESITRNNLDHWNAFLKTL